MANSKYQINVATKADYKPLQQASAAQSKFREELKATRAESKKLANSQRDLKAFTNTKNDMLKTKESIEHTRQALKSLGDQVAKSGGKMTAAQRKQGDAQRKQLKAMLNVYEQQQRKVRALGKELSSSSVSANDFTKSQRLLAAKTLSANKKLEQQKAKIDQVRRVEDYLEKRRQRAFNNEQQRLFKLKKLESSLEQARGRRNSQALSVGAAAAYMATGAIAVKKAADVESAMVDVSKKASFKTKSGAELSRQDSDKQLTELQNWIVKEAPNLGMDAVDLATIVASGAGANVARAGREQEDLRQFSQLAAKMSVAFDNLSAAEAGESVATWMSSMNLDMSQAGELASTINHLSDNSAAQTGAITDLMTRSGSIMMSGGLDHKQAAALGTAILSANGNNSEMGATAAKNMALTLTQGDAMSGSQKRVLNDLGMDPIQLAKDMQSDSVSTIYSLIEKIQQKPEYLRNSIVSSLFGKESIGAINPLINNVKELKRVMVASSDEAAIRTSLENEFSKQQNTSNFQMQRAKNAFGNLTAALAQHLLPMVEAGAEALADMAIAGTEFIQENEKLASVVVKGVAAIALLKAGTVAWRLASTAMEIVSLKRKVSEVKLGSATTKTTAMAVRAAAAIDRLNASLGRTSARGAAGGFIPESGKRRRGGRSKGGGLKAGSLNKIRKGAGKLPLVGTAVSAGLGAYMLNDTLSSDSETKGQETGELVGSIGGSLAGAAAGAAIGSVVPVIGTAIGGIIGAIAGEEIFSWIGGEIGSEFDKPSEKEKPAAAPAKIKPSYVTSSSHDSFGEKISAAEILSSSAVTNTFSPTIQINGSADKGVVDTALKESEQRYKQFMNASLSDRLDASMSDSIPNY